MLRIHRGDRMTPGVRLPPFEPLMPRNPMKALALVRSYLSPLSRSISSTDGRLHEEAEECIDKLARGLSLGKIPSNLIGTSHIQYLDLLQEPEKGTSRFWALMSLQRFPDAYDIRNAFERASVTALLNYEIIGTPSGFANPPFMINRIDFAGVQRDFEYTLRDWTRLREQIA